jgi:EpsI family protein
MLLVVALVVLHFRSAGEAMPIRRPLESFPMTIGAWQGREATIFEVDVLNVLKVRDYLMRRYVGPDGRSLWLYIGYWDTQRRGAQIHSPKNCLPGSGWEPLEATQVTIPLANGRRAITVNKYLVQKDREQQLVLYWYDAQGRAIADEVAARIAMVKTALLANRSDGALIRVSSEVYGTTAQTSDRLVDFIQRMYPVVGEYLPD